MASEPGYPIIVIATGLLAKIPRPVIKASTSEEAEWEFEKRDLDSSLYKLGIPLSCLENVKK